MELPNVPEKVLLELLRYRLEDPLEDALLEYADYLGQPFEEMKAFYEQLLKTTPEEASPSVQILPVLVSAVQLKHILERLQIMLGFGLSVRGASFLDIGAGVGRDCIAFARCGIRATHADVPWPGQDFSRWRYAQRKLNVHFADACSLPPERHAIIGCHDVFEHVEDPVELMVRFVTHLIPFGLCFTSFDLFNPLPTHLPKNNFYATFYDALLKHLGMELVLGYVNPVQDVCVARMRIYQRKRPIIGTFETELAQIRKEAYAFARQELGALHALLTSEKERVQQIDSTQTLAA